MCMIPLEAKGQAWPLTSLPGRGPLSVRLRCKTGDTATDAQVRKIAHNERAKGMREEKSENPYPPPGAPE